MDFRRSNLNPLDGAYRNMLSRCYDPKNKNYKNYGGRGIRVCDEWLQDFTTFCLDMGTRPTPKHSIDRVDNNGHYTPNNCRWSTSHEQSINKRTYRGGATQYPHITKNKAGTFNVRDKFNKHLGTTLTLCEAVKMFESNSKTDVKVGRVNSKTGHRYIAHHPNGYRVRVKRVSLGIYRDLATALQVRNKHLATP